MRDEGGTVSSSAAGSIDRRDAAVAAALAGAVVVVLGYASGVGIQTSSDQVAVQQPPAAQPAAPQTEGTEITTSPVPVAQSPVLYAAPAARIQHQHTRPSTPNTPVEPIPTPEPEPEPTPPTCPPSLLEGLPVAGPVAGATSSLLLHVISTTPVLSAAAGQLACTMGDLVGPACCSPAASTGADTRVEAGP
jgi:hypothetical protein